MKISNDGPRAMGKQGGFSLMGLVFALVIGLVVTTGVVMLVNRATGTNDATQGVQRLMTIKSVILSVYPSPNYNGLTSELLVKTDKIPMQMQDGSGGISNVWGSAVEVTPTEGDRQFQILTNDVPTAQCTSMVPVLATNFREVTVGTTIVKNPSTPYNPTTAITACNSGTGYVDLTLVDA